MESQKSSNISSPHSSGWRNKLASLGLGVALFSIISCSDGTKPVSTEKTSDGEKIEHYTDFDVAKNGDTAKIIIKNNATIVTYAHSKGKNSFEICVTSKEHPEEIYVRGNGIGRNTHPIEIVNK